MSPRTTLNTPADGLGQAVIVVRKNRGDRIRQARSQASPVADPANQLRYRVVACTKASQVLAGAYKVSTVSKTINLERVPSSHLSVPAIETVVAAALRDFEAWLSTAKWMAKENDCVNHFAHAFLAKRASPGTVFYDIGQIGIEVAVPQPAGHGVKQAVRKDLVIWGAPGMTTWDEDYRAHKIPIAIVEWKARKKRLSQDDLNWLAKFTAQFPDCFGAAVTVDFSTTQPELHTAAIRSGVVEKNWLHRKQPLPA